MKPAGIVRTLLLLTSFTLFVYFLSWHWRLGLVRYFDADEFAHLHWAAKIMEGKRPYVDFLSFFPPGYAWSLMPALASGWGTVQPFITARIMTFVIFTLMCGVTGLIFWEMRRSVWAAVLAAALLAFLPLPFDKYLEIRPDNLATLFMLVAVYFQIKWMTISIPGIRTPLILGIDSTSRQARRIFYLYKPYWPPAFGFFSGFFYSLSYIVLPKMIPNIGVGVLIALVYGFQVGEVRVIRGFRLGGGIRNFVLGLVTPIILFALWTLTLGNSGLVWYSLFKLPVEANQIGKYFIMMQDLFFYPNGIYYGSDGWNPGVYANLFVWLAGILMASWRLVVPAIGSSVSKKYVYAEILLALQFWIQMAFYIQIVPLKHPQYLIPVGVFIAWYAADGILVSENSIRQHILGKTIFVCLFLFLSFQLFTIFRETNEPKLAWTNKQLQDQTARFYQIIPKGEPVLDLNGQILYNPDAYYACCIPFGQFAQFLSRPLPDLPTQLEKTNTKYIAQGGLERVNTLPEAWQQYIFAHYHPHPGDNALLVRNDVP